MCPTHDHLWVVYLAIPSLSHTTLLLTPFPPLPPPPPPLTPHPPIPVVIRHHPPNWPPHLPPPPLLTHPLAPSLSSSSLTPRTNVQKHPSKSNCLSNYNKSGKADFKTLHRRDKILLSLNKYGVALDCFKLTLLDPRSGSNPESINGYWRNARKLNFLLELELFDLSDWVLNRYHG